MNRALLTIVLGLGVGVAAHFGYYQFHRPAGLDSLDGQLAWMRDELKLDATQYAQIRELHKASSPRLRALAVEVARMQAEFAAFEHTRRTSDKVDFIEFAQFVEMRRNINRECLESTRQLVRATAGVMTPEQRAHYFGIVSATDSLKDF
jgi:hypothetical protein